jgi:hypothetical protein
MLFQDREVEQKQLPFAIHVIARHTEEMGGDLTMAAWLAKA